MRISWINFLRFIVLPQSASLRKKVRADAVISPLTLFLLFIKAVPYLLAIHPFILLSRSGPTMGKRKYADEINPILYNAHLGITGLGSINNL